MNAAIALRPKENPLMAERGDECHRAKTFDRCHRPMTFSLCSRTMTFVYEISEPRRLGRALREKRRRQGLTQADPARRAQVSRGWLIRLEAGHGTAETDTVFRVIAALGLTVTLAPSQDAPEERAAQSAFESI